MFLLRLTIAFTTLLLISCFLLLNIQDMQVGQGYVLVAIAIILSALNYSVSPQLQRQISFRYAHLYLAIFIIYFLINIIIDTVNLQIVKSYSFGTESGLLFFIILGITVSSALSSIIYAHRNAKNEVIVCCGVLLTILFVTLWQAVIFQFYLSQVRDDIFLITQDSGLYQRPGNFLLIQSLISSAIIISTWTNQSLSGRIVTAISLLICIASFVITALTAQLIGSNSAFISSLGLLTLLIVVVCFSGSRRFMAGRHPITLRSILIGKLGGRILWTSIFVIACSLAFTAIAIQYMNINLGRLRIFGFGTGDMSSVSSRLEIIQSNFLTHFLYNPILGNTNVEALTTGEGTYIHSLLSVLTHLGLLGLILFIAFMKSVFNEFKNDWNQDPKCPLEYPIYRLFQLLALCFLILLCMIATFFTWAPLWFGLGMISLGFRSVPARQKSTVARASPKTNANWDAE